VTRANPNRAGSALPKHFDHLVGAFHAMTALGEGLEFEP
jgi:hypothetical protein